MRVPTEKEIKKITALRSKGDIVIEICRKVGISPNLYYQWNKFGYLEVDVLQEKSLKKKGDDNKHTEIVVTDKDTIKKIIREKAIDGIDEERVKSLTLDSSANVIKIDSVTCKPLSGKEKVIAKAPTDVTDEKKRAIGLPMTNPVKDPKTGHFSHGNPGKPKGSKDWRTRFIEAITPAKAEMLISKYVQLIEFGRDNVEGDVEAILFGMKRLFPENSTQRYVNIDLKKHKVDLNELSGVNDAVGVVIDEVSSSSMSIDEGKEFIELLEKKQNFNLGKLQEEADKFIELQKEESLKR